jgi:hypothetical protein
MSAGLTSRGGDNQPSPHAQALPPWRGKAGDEADDNQPDVPDTPERIDRILYIATREYNLIGTIFELCAPAHTVKHRWGADLKVAGDGLASKLELP